MPRRVLRWTVPVDDQDHPIGAGPVVLVTALSPSAVLVWTEEEDEPRFPRRARVYSTGQVIGRGEVHIGSCVTGLSGMFARHVFAADLAVKR